MSNKYLALVIILVTAKLYMDHQKQGYDGPYTDTGSYDNITPMKHDLFKQTTLDLFPLLVYGLASGDKFYDQDNILNSFVGKLLVSLASYAVYYQLVEPYIVQKVRRF